jgi:hypothetical protein
MAKKKQIFSKVCALPSCKTKFKTVWANKIYHHHNCGKYAHDLRQKEKIRKATEILRSQVGL